MSTPMPPLGTKTAMAVFFPCLEHSKDPGGPTGSEGDGGRVHMLATLLTLLLLFSAPTCVLCRSSLAPTRSTSPTASSGTRGKSAANPREYLRPPKTTSHPGAWAPCMASVGSPRPGPAF